MDGGGGDGGSVDGGGGGGDGGSGGSVDGGGSSSDSVGGDGDSDGDCGEGEGRRGWRGTVKSSFFLTSIIYLHNLCSNAFISSASNTQDNTQNYQSIILRKS